MMGLAPMSLFHFFLHFGWHELQHVTLLFIFCSWKLLWPVLTKRCSWYCLRASLGASVWWGLRQNPVLVSHMGKNIRATGGTGGSSHRKTWSTMSYEDATPHLCIFCRPRLDTIMDPLWSVGEEGERSIMNCWQRTTGQKDLHLRFSRSHSSAVCGKSKSFCPVSEQVLSSKDANSIG